MTLELIKSKPLYMVTPVEVEWLIAAMELLNAENEELAEGVLRLSATLRYLNGMVSRGRGSDISDDIEANIKGYVIELETELAKAKPVLDAAEYINERMSK